GLEVDDAVREVEQHLGLVEGVHRGVDGGVGLEDVAGGGDLGAHALLAGPGEELVALAGRGLGLAVRVGGGGLVAVVGGLVGEPVDGVDDARPHAGVRGLQVPAAFVVVGPALDVGEPPDLAAVPVDDSFGVAEVVPLAGGHRRRQGDRLLGGRGPAARRRGRGGGLPREEGGEAVAVGGGGRPGGGGVGHACGQAAVDGGDGAAVGVVARAGGGEEPLSGFAFGEGAGGDERAEVEGGLVELVVLFAVGGAGDAVAFVGEGAAGVGVEAFRGERHRCGRAGGRGGGLRG